MNTIQHYSKSLLISLFLILSIGNVWGWEHTFTKGTTIYYDLTQYGGGANIYSPEGDEFGTWKDESAVKNVISVTLTKDLKITDQSPVFKSGATNWSGVKMSTQWQEGNDMIISVDGRTATWGTYEEHTIYFQNTVNWDNVYVYFYQGSYWSDDKGSGAKNIQHNQMTKISGEGTSAIYKFTYMGNSPAYVSFTRDAQGGCDNFEQTEAVYRGDYNASNPMYVPNPTRSGIHNNNTTYYNNGTWGTMHRLKSKTAYGTFFSNVYGDEGQISFFATKEKDTLCVQTMNNGTWQDGKPLTLGLSADGIFTATMDANGIVNNVQPYTGDLTVYHLDGTPRDYKGDQGKLVDFRDVSTTYYDHYHMEYINGNTDLGATMGNSTNTNIANTLESHQASNCNVRYEYNSKTNRLSQTVIAGSQESKFLSIYGNGLNNTQNSTLTKDNPLTLTDGADWLYTADFLAIKTDNSAISACLMATYNNQQSWILAANGQEDGANASYPILGASTKEGTYNIMLMYDYKTNRITAGWKPQGNFEVENQYAIDANLLLTREEDNDVAQITIKNDISKISNLQKVVLVMQFNRDKQTGESQYKFSLPFDCRIKDIYGLPYGYMNSWGIQRYNGAERARTGWFQQDRPTFWEWMNYNDTLRAGEGYSLTVDRSAVGTWYADGKGAKYLYFPSMHTGFNITKSSANNQVTYPDQPCNINLRYPDDPDDTNHRDRRKYDSNWKLIGPKNYNNITIKSSDIAWNGDYYLSPDEPSFVYVLDKDKKVYEAQSTTDFVFRAFFSYFVQFAGTITWQQYTQSETLKPAPRYAPQTTRKPAEFRIDLKDLNDNDLDRTFVALSPIGTEGFDLNLDLTKIDVQHPMIYTISENTDYAGNTLSLNTDTVALVVKTGTGGSYTIALPNENNDYDVVLVDKFEQQVNVLTPEGYPIQVEPGITRNRFYLVFAPKTGTSQPDGPTTNLQKTATDTNVRKVLINGKIYIVRDNRLYDITGKILTR